MFSRSKPESAPKPLKAGAPGLSFIGTEVVVSGDITTGGQLHVDGRIDGHVRCGQLCQGKSGTVTGNIDAEEARIGGLVEGTVAARNLVLESSARIKGDIVYQTISVAAGAQVDGRLARREALVSPEEQPSIVIAAAIADAKPRKTDQATVAEDIFSLSPPRQAAAG